MKRGLLIVGMGFCASVLSAALLRDQPPLAVYGCCKERQNYWGPWWKTQKDFKTCEQNNDRIDRDNVFEEEGHIWWDLEC